MKKQPEEETGKFETFYITFRMCVMGDENTLGPESHMLVATQGGVQDAIEACRKYHRGCKIICVQNKLQEAAGVKLPVDKIPETAKLLDKVGEA